MSTDPATTTGSRTVRITSALALAAGAVLLVKGLTASFAGGNALPEWAFGTLYILGIALVVAAATGLGALQRRWPLKLVVGFAAAVVSLMWLMTLGEVLEAGVAALTDDRTTQEEAAVVALGVVWFAVGMRLRRQSPARDSSARRPLNPAQAG